MKYNFGEQRGLAVKRPPGNQEVGGSNHTAVHVGRKMKIGPLEAPCTECAPIVHHDLSARPANKC